MIYETVGTLIMFVGVIFVLIGIFGIYKFKCFYARILVVSKIDTVGAVIFLTGMAIRHGFSFFSGKLLLILIIILILSPLTGHMIVRAAYLSGHKLDKKYRPDHEADSKAGDNL